MIYDILKIVFNYSNLGGEVRVDHVDYGDILDETDYSPAVLTSNIGVISTSDTVGWKTLDVTLYLKAGRQDARGYSQFMFYFPIEVGKANDFAQFRSGMDIDQDDNEACLEIIYYED